MTTVRDGAAGDAEAVEAVWAAVAGELEWIGSELPLAPGWGKRFRSALTSKDSAWFVAEVDAQVVGESSSPIPPGSPTLAWRFWTGIAGSGSVVHCSMQP